MHLTRKESSKKLPIPRKGTKYLAVARLNRNEAVPVVVALRDMIKIARTAKEVREMIKNKAIKINWRTIYDLNDSIQLFNILEAGKSYRLSLLPTGKFFFEEVKSKDVKLCKIIGKKLLNYGIQYNMHDGSNLVTKDKLSIGDSVYLDFSGKIKSHAKVEKGKEILVISGKYIGEKGKIDLVSEKDNSVKIKLENKEDKVVLNKNSFVVL